METTARTGATPEDTGQVHAPDLRVVPGQRFPVVSGRQRAQFVFAALMWTVASLILGIRGAGWLIGAAYALPLLVIAVALGGLKYRLVMAPVARRISARIRDRGPGSHPLGFFSWRSWGVVALMVAGGHALRLTSAPRVWLGVLYAAVATGLALGSSVFWRAAVKK